MYLLFIEAQWATENRKEPILTEFNLSPVEVHKFSQVWALFCGVAIFY